MLRRWERGKHGWRTERKAVISEDRAVTRVQVTSGFIVHCGEWGFYAESDEHNWKVLKSLVISAWLSFGKYCFGF